MTAALVLALAAGAGDFLQLQRKAEARREPAERVEWFSRAISAWTEAHGRALLANCHLRRGEAYAELGQEARALADLDKAAELDSRSAPAYLLRGRLRLKQGKAKAAARDLSEYAALAPEDIEGFLLLGEARRKAGELAASLKAYASAAQLEPLDYRPALGRGLTLMKARDWSEAERALDLAVRLSKSREPQAFIERAVTRVALRRKEEAVSDYTDALALAEDARAYYGRGRLTGSQDDLKAACRLGHRKACALIKPEPPKPARRPKVAAPDSDPGERIYAQ